MGGALKLHDPLSEKEGNFSRIPICAKNKVYRMACKLLQKNYKHWVLFFLE
jgi:hypothetical protein